MSRGKVLFYCQHLLGVGHISRSLAICQGLLERFDVVFVQGGPDIGRSLERPGFERVLLPPLLMREHDSSLYDPVAGRPVEEVLAARNEALEWAKSQDYAAVIVEMFPFGRFKLKHEIIGLIEAARQVNPQARIYCSNRDIMVQKPDQEAREAKIIGILDAHFDAVLVHSDPALIALGDTFGSAGLLGERVIHTGYVTDSTAFPEVLPPREKRVLVSVGGGAIGDDLALAVAGIAERFPDWEFRFLTGPYSSGALRSELRARTGHLERASVHGFSDDFRGELLRAGLSISLAGYNTLMDILSTRTPALVHPYMANREQDMRASLLAERGLVGLLYDGDLQPDLLERAIRDRMAAPLPETGIDLSGARRTAEIVIEELA
ncbi:glycosyltransferase family protein [Mangrovicoccus ximenensis]|uniref:glycosyltransferase family protein n=1 Tax=Mangrovicoccus ximenensis TaxID=1911570 RepID=UPI000D3D5119|nr:glycosyltransferase [Mangrovicoccus ximenensis]